MDGASEERAGMSITGQADIEVVDTCEMVLKVSRSRHPYFLRRECRSHTMHCVCRAALS